MALTYEVVGLLFDALEAAFEVLDLFQDAVWVVSVRLIYPLRKVKTRTVTEHLVKVRVVKKPCAAALHDVCLVEGEAH